MPIQLPNPVDIIENTEFSLPGDVAEVLDAGLGEQQMEQQQGGYSSISTSDLLNAIGPSQNQPPPPRIEDDERDMLAVLDVGITGQTQSQRPFSMDTPKEIDAFIDDVTAVTEFEHQRHQQAEQFTEQFTQANEFASNRLNVQLEELGQRAFANNGTIDPGAIDWGEIERGFFETNPNLPPEAFNAWRTQLEQHMPQIASAQTMQQYLNSAREGGADWRNWTMWVMNNVVPFGHGGGLGLAHTVRPMVERIQSGQGTATDFRSVAAILAEAERTEEQGPLAEFATGLTHSLQFMAEFGLTGGLFSAPRAAITGMASRTISRLGLTGIRAAALRGAGQVAGFGAGALTQAAAFSPRMFDTWLERNQPGLGVAEGPGGAELFQAEVPPERQISLGGAFLHTTIELVAERAGGGLARIPGLGRVFSAGTPRALRNFGVHGFLGEMLEERLTEIGHAVAGLEEVGITQALYENARALYDPTYEITPGNSALEAADNFFNELAILGTIGLGGGMLTNTRTGRPGSERWQNGQFRTMLALQSARRIVNPELRRQRMDDLRDAVEYYDVTPEYEARQEQIFQQQLDAAATQQAETPVSPNAPGLQRGPGTAESPPPSLPTQTPPLQPPAPAQQQQQAPAQQQPAQTQQGPIPATSSTQGPPPTMQPQPAQATQQPEAGSPVAETGTATPPPATSQEQTTGIRPPQEIADNLDQIQEIQRNVVDLIRQGGGAAVEQAYPDDGTPQNSYARRLARGILVTNGIVNDAIRGLGVSPNHAGILRFALTDLPAIQEGIAAGRFTPEEIEHLARREVTITPTDNDPDATNGFSFYIEFNDQQASEQAIQARSQTTVSEQLQPGSTDLARALQAISRVARSEGVSIRYDATDANRPQSQDRSSEAQSRAEMYARVLRREGYELAKEVPGERGATAFLWNPTGTPARERRGAAKKTKVKPKPQEAIEEVHDAEVDPNDRNAVLNEMLAEVFPTVDARAEDDGVQFTFAGRPVEILHHGSALEVNFWNEVKEGEEGKWHIPENLQPDTKTLFDAFSRLLPFARERGLNIRYEVPKNEEGRKSPRSRHDTYARRLTRQGFEEVDTGGDKFRLWKPKPTKPRPSRGEARPKPAPAQETPQEAAKAKLAEIDRLNTERLQDEDDTRTFNDVLNEVLAEDETFMDLLGDVYGWTRVERQVVNIHWNTDKDFREIAATETVIGQRGSRITSGERIRQIEAKALAKIGPNIGSIADLKAFFKVVEKQKLKEKSGTTGEASEGMHEGWAADPESRLADLWTALLVKAESMGLSPVEQVDYLNEQLPPGWNSVQGQQEVAAWINTEVNKQRPNLIRLQQLEQELAKEQENAKKTQKRRGKSRKRIQAEQQKDIRAGEREADDRAGVGGERAKDSGGQATDAADGTESADGERPTDIDIENRADEIQKEENDRRSNNRSMLAEVREFLQERNPGIWPQIKRKLIAGDADSVKGFDEAIQIVFNKPRYSDIFAGMDVFEAESAVVDWITGRGAFDTKPMTKKAAKEQAIEELGEPEQTTINEDGELVLEDGTVLFGGPPIHFTFLDKFLTKNPIGRLLRRWFSIRLTEAQYQSKIRSDGRIAQALQDVRYAERDLVRVVRREFGGRLQPAEVAQMNDALGGDQAAFAELPASIQSLITRMRDHMDTLSASLIQNGVVQGDLAITIQENLGTYLHRSYEVFTDPAWADKVPEDVKNRFKSWLRAERIGHHQSRLGEMKRILDKHRGLHGPQTIDAAMQGDQRAMNTLPKVVQLAVRVSQESPRISEQQLHDDMMSLLVNGTAAENPIRFLTQSKLGSKDLTILKRLKDLSPELRALWGEKKDPMVNYANVVMRVTRLLSNHIFLSEVAESGLGTHFFENPTETENGQHYYQIASQGSQSMGPLAGLYTTKEMKDAFEDIYAPRNESAWLRAYMSAIAMTKYAKTVGSLGTHARNFISNIGFMVANGHFNLKHIPKAFSTTFRDTPEGRSLWRRMLELRVVGDEVRAGEVRQLINDLNTHQDLPFVEAMGLITEKHMQKWARKGTEALTGLYRAEDAVWKIYAWLNEVDNYRQAYPGWTQEQVEQKAADNVRNTTPTYSLVPPAIQALRRFPFIGPFVSFSSEVFRNTYHTIRLGFEEISQPETRSIGARRLAGTSFAIAGVGWVAMGIRALLGYDADDEEAMRRFLAPWSKNSLLIHLPQDSNGDYRYIDGSYSDPYAILRAPFIAAMRGEILEAGGELLEPFVSEDIFSGRVIDSLRPNNNVPGYNRHAPTMDRAIAVSSHIAGAFVPGTYDNARRIIMSLSGQQERRSGRRYDFSEEMIGLVFGQRISRINPRIQLPWNARAFQSGQSGMTQIITTVGRQHGLVSDQELISAYDASEQQRRMLWDSMRADILAARRLGLTNAEIDSALTQANISEVNRQNLVDAVYEPYVPSLTLFGNEPQHQQRAMTVIQHALGQMGEQQRNEYFGTMMFRASESTANPSALMLLRAINVPLGNRRELLVAEETRRVEESNRRAKEDGRPANRRVNWSSITRRLQRLNRRLSQTPDPQSP